jgi:hypothetical protein
MPKVFVAGALIPTGGAYMAYHLGRLLHHHFGYELIDIAIYPVEKQIFRYDTPVRTVSIAQMEGMIGEDDLMIVNPSFSQFLFGLRLPGRKIMYIQDFRTFLLLDCHFDMYVAVSSVVSRYVHALYGITAPVIPAFIQLNRLPPARPWHERPPGSALVYMKNASQEHRILFSELTAQLKKTAPQIDLSHVLEGRNLSHTEFLQQLGSVRYFVNMSLAEGFGLVPLEAMAMGTMVTGVDGLAGRDYLRHGQNCLVGSIRDLRPLPQIIMQAFTDEALAAKCAAGGQATARLYGHAPFKAAWLRQFCEFLGVEPSHG